MSRHYCNTFVSMGIEEQEDTTFAGRVDVIKVFTATCVDCHKVRTTVLR